MKKILKYKKTIIISLILILIFVFTLIITKFANNKKDELSELKDAIENIFYYLPNDNYTTMNDLSDTCKLALIYDTKYLKSDYVFYDNNGKENKGYTKNNVLNSLKNIIGEESIIDFNKDNSGEYKFFYPDNCTLINHSVSNLTYDEQKQVFYSIEEEQSNKKLYINWSDEEVQGNNITLTAKALMAVKTDSGYDLYVDYNMENLIGSYGDIEKLESELETNYYKSYNYEFSIIKNDDKYAWVSYKREKIDEDIIYD